MQYLNIFLKAMRRSGYNVSNPSELRDIKKAIAEYYNVGYEPGNPKRIELDDNLDDWARIEPFLEVQHKQGFITKEFIREIGDIFDDIRASRSADEVRFDKDNDFGGYALGVNLAEDIPDEVFRNNLIDAFGQSEVEAAVRIKKDSGIKGRDPGKWGIKTSENWEDELVWLLEGRNHPEHPMLYERVDGAASKYIGNKSNPTPPSGEGITSIKDAGSTVGSSLDNISKDIETLINNKKIKNKTLNDAIDEIDPSQATDNAMTDDWVDRRISEIDTQTKVMDATTVEIAEAKLAMDTALDQGRVEEAKTIADELRRMGVKLDKGEYGLDIPTDMSNILKKPEHATGGRVGYAGGGGPHRDIAPSGPSRDGLESLLRKLSRMKDAADDEKRARIREKARMPSGTNPRLESMLRQLSNMKDGVNDEQRARVREEARIGLEGGGGPLDKMKMSRRGFLGLMGSGIAAGVAGAKGWLTGGKTAATAVKGVAEMSASGMPKWFPLLVNKIRTKGKAKPASYSDVKNGEPNIVVYEYKDPDISIEPIRMEENLDTGVIEVTGRGNESQLVTMTYYAPETAVNVRTGTKSGAKEGEFVVDEMTKHPEHGWIETGAEDYASLKGGVENWEAAVKTKTKQDYKDEYEEFIKNQRGQEEPFDPEGTFKLGGLVPPTKGPLSNGLGTRFKEKQTWL